MLRRGSVTLDDPACDHAPCTLEIEPFYIGKSPITNLQLEAYDPAHERSPVGPGDDDPAGGVTFGAAAGYCDWYAGVSGKPIRLPSEAEWEYACRANTTSRYFFGDDPTDGAPHAWDLASSAGRIRPLSAKTPNPFGLLGMLGTVWEWTASLHRPYPVSAAPDSADAPGPRVLRGGSFRTSLADIGSGVRRPADPDLTADDIGFRIVRSFKSPSGDG